jgi:hypothetical protein
MDIDALAALAANTIVATSVSDDTGGNVTNTISGTVRGPVLMGRDFGDITIGGPENQPWA